MLSFTLRGYFSRLLLSHCALAENIQQLCAFYLFIVFLFFLLLTVWCRSRVTQPLWVAANPSGQVAYIGIPEVTCFLWFFFLYGGVGCKVPVRGAFLADGHKWWRHTAMLMRRGMARNCMTRSLFGIWRQNVELFSLDVRHWEGTVTLSFLTSATLTLCHSWVTVFVPLFTSCVVSPKPQCTHLTISFESRFRVNDTMYSIHLKTHNFWSLFLRHKSILIQYN